MSAVVENNIIRSPRNLVTPITVLACTVLVLPLMLLIISTVPIGSSYWDLYIYFDAANRIFDGQAPHADFFAPVGPLGYWLFAGAVTLFPNAQPLLLVEWSLFAVSAPLMALLLFDVDRQSRPVAYGLLLPYLFFSILPFNVRDYFMIVGSDGFAIYNRQAAILLYLLVASLVFVRSQTILTVLLAVLMTALLLTKITSLAVAGPVCLLALAAGRLHLKSAIAAGLIFVAVLGAIEWSSGIVSAYLANMYSLFTINSGGLVSLLASAVARNFKVVFPIAVLIGLYLLLDRRAWLQTLRSVFKRPSVSAFNRLFDHNAVWLAVVAFSGVVFESQNWGSQDMIFVWPVLLAVIVDVKLPDRSSSWQMAMRVLAFAAIIPIVLLVGERAVRASAGNVRNLPLEHANLKTVGAVNLLEFHTERARKFAKIYPEHRDTYETIAAAGVLPSFALYMELKYQIGYLMHIDDAITAIRALEADKDVRFDTLFHISFTNPFPWLMDRSAPRHVAIGADPFRAVPDPDGRVLDAVSKVDMALFPTCPVITANTKMLNMFGEALRDHRRIRLTPCYDAFVHPGKVTAMQE